MPDTCPECGAAVPDGRTCRDHFHALLLLESEIPGVPGSIAHFYAVAAYSLQHPESMNCTRDAVCGLRATLADVLDGRTGVGDLRRRGRRATDGSVRVTRRVGDPVASWYHGPWAVTIADICTADTFGCYDTYEEFADRVTRWARLVRETLDASGI
jgi:Family of unknown function (DUF5946)